MCLMCIGDIMCIDAVTLCLPLSAHYNELQRVPEVVQEAFKEVAEGKGYLTPADLKSFLENVQGDASLTEAQAEEIVAKYKNKEPSPHPLLNIFRDSSREVKEPLLNDGLDLVGFAKMLLDPDLNGPLKPKQLNQDMTKPLSQYYVFTSHNTYLTGNQVWSRSSVVPIIEALHSGCRVIELDCWEKKGKIKVLHGGTLTSAVDFDPCIIAIKENAFKASPYPVIITIENHLRPELQIEAAKILKEILGDELFIPTAEQRHPKKFLSPEELRGKIIISDKPYHAPVEEQVTEDPEGAQDIFAEGAQELLGRGGESPDLSPKAGAKFDFPGGVKLMQRGARAFDEATLQPEVSNAAEFDELLYIYCEKPSEMREKQIKGGPLIGGAEAIMANVSESQFKTFIKTHPGSIIEYTKKNLGRMYPSGLRLDSSNFDPMLAWSHGGQMAAMNIQGQDRGTWLGRAFFLTNGGCGYVKKPQVFLQGSFLRYQEILSLPPKLRLKVKVLLGTDWHRVFDLFKRPDFYVRVATKGIASDTLRKQTKVAFNDKEPNWEDEEFEFPIRVPELAVLRFEVWEHDRFNPDDFVGQFCMPVTEINQGIRVVQLCSRKGTEVSSKLLCQFTFEDLESPKVGTEVAYTAPVAAAMQ